jgi:hypothetical protein
MKDETVGLDWEEEYKKIEHSHRCQLEEIKSEFRKKLDNERNTKNAIIEQQRKEIEFYKEIIKGILHIK